MGLTRKCFRKNISSTNIILKSAAGPIDPIQKLYADKVIQYGTKKEASGEIFVDGTKEDKALLEEELDKIGQSFGGGKGVDMISFPSFKFKDPIIDATDPLSEEIFFVTGVSEVEKIRNEVLVLKSHVDRLNKERDELTVKMEEEDNISSLAIHELQSENEKLGRHIQSLHMDSSELKEKNKVEIEAKGFELNEMKSSLANSNKNLTKLESENKDLTKNLSLVMQEKLKMEEELQEKEKLTEEIESLQRGMDTLKEKNNAQMDSLNLNLNELKSSLAESSEKLSKLENEKNDVSNKFFAAMEEKARMEEEIENQISTLKRAHEAEVRSLQTQLEEAQTTKDHRQNFSQGLEKQLENSNREGSEQNNGVSSKKKDIKAVENKLDDKTTLNK